MVLIHAPQFPDLFDIDQLLTGRVLGGVIGRCAHIRTIDFCTTYYKSFGCTILCIHFGVTLQSEVPIHVSVLSVVPIHLQVGACSFPQKVTLVRQRRLRSFGLFTDSCCCISVSSASDSIIIWSRGLGALSRHRRHLSQLCLFGFLLSGKRCESGNVWLGRGQLVCVEHHTFEAADEGIGEGAELYGGGGLVAVDVCFAGMFFDLGDGLEFQLFAEV